MTTPREVDARDAIISTAVVLAVSAVLALGLAVTSYDGVLRACSWPVRVAGTAAVFGLMFVLSNAVLFRPVAYLVMFMVLPLCGHRR